MSAAILLAGKPQASIAQTKIAVVHVKTVMDKYHLRKKMVDDINLYAESKNRSLDSRKATYQQMTSEMVVLDKRVNNPTLIEKERIIARKQLVELSAARDAKASEISDLTRRAEQEILQRRQKLEAELSADIKNAVAVVSNAKGVDIALDNSFLPNTTFKSVLYVSNNVTDLTSDVIAVLNK